MIIKSLHALYGQRSKNGASSDVVGVNDCLTIFLSFSDIIVNIVVVISISTLNKLYFTPCLIVFVTFLNCSLPIVTLRTPFNWKKLTKIYRIVLQTNHSVLSMIRKWSNWIKKFNSQKTNQFVSSYFVGILVGWCYLQALSCTLYIFSFFQISESFQKDVFTPYKTAIDQTESTPTNEFTTSEWTLLCQRQFWITLEILAQKRKSELFNIELLTRQDYNANGF